MYKETDVFLYIGQVVQSVHFLRAFLYKKLVYLFNVN